MAGRITTGRITVVGLGPGSPSAIPLGALELLEGPGRNILRTRIHPSVEWLTSRGIRFEALDWAYDRGRDFAGVYRLIVNFLLQESAADHLIYAVPGHPLVAERTVEMLLEEGPGAGVEVEIGPGASALDAIFSAAQLDPSAGLQILDAQEAGLRTVDPATGALWLQVYDRAVASDLKLAMMEVYPDDFLVIVISSAGIPGQERVETVPLYGLDRVSWIDHLTSVYFPPLVDSVAASRDAAGGTAAGSLRPLMDVVRRLRGPGGCPWDREQTHLSLRQYLIEEAFEVAEAIDSQEMNKLREEMGDLLLQIALHSAMAEEEGSFTIDDVVEEITEKMIRRHPHVFGGARVSSSGEVLDRWDRIKAAERAGQAKVSALDGVPPAMPALQRAYEIGKKAAKVGFDWDRLEGAWSKIEEELLELREARAGGDQAKVAGELGDVLFSICNIARFLKVEPESALSLTIQKFTRRFKHIEERARERGLELGSMTLEQMDELWNEAKSNLIKEENGEQS